MPTKNRPMGRADFADAGARATIEAAAAGLVPSRGLTTGEVAQRYRVGEDRVRGWIRAGVLRALNVADATCARPRFVVLPEDLAAFERTRAVAPPTKPVKRPSRRVGEVDFFPD